MKNEVENRMLEVQDGYKTVELDDDRPADVNATLGDTLRELRPVETVTTCEECPCCYQVPFILSAHCSDRPELRLGNLRIMHADCPRRSKRTEWSP